MTDDCVAKQRCIVLTVFMNLFETMSSMGHEQLVLAHDKSTGYRGMLQARDITYAPDYVVNKSAIAAGWSYAELIGRILNHATERYPHLQMLQAQSRS